MKRRVKIIAGAVLLGVLAVAGLVVLLMPVRGDGDSPEGRPSGYFYGIGNSNSEGQPVCMCTAVRYRVRSGSQRRRDCRAGCKDRRTG